MYVINLIVDPDILLCYQVSSFLQPGCNVLCRVLEAAAGNEFTILFTEFYQVFIILLISSASWPLPDTAFRPSLPTLLLKSPASMVMCDVTLSNFLHSLSRFLYSFLILFSPVWGGRVYVYDVDILWFHLNSTDFDSTFACWFALILWSINKGITIPG